LLRLAEHIWVLSICFFYISFIDMGSKVCGVVSRHPRLVDMGIACSGVLARMEQDPTRQVVPCGCAQHVFVCVALSLLKFYCVWIWMSVCAVADWVICAPCAQVLFLTKVIFGPSHFVDEVCVCAHCIISARAHGNASSTWYAGQFMPAEWVCMEQLVGRRAESG
jgi:hypothetical protein